MRNVKLRNNKIKKMRERENQKMWNGNMRNLKNEKMIKCEIK